MPGPGPGAIGRGDIWSYSGDGEAAVSAAQAESVWLQVNTTVGDHSSSSQQPNDLEAEMNTKHTMILL